MLCTCGLSAQESPLPGSRPGTEQWLVWLRDRSFDLRAEIQQIRTAPTATQRRELLAQLEQRAATDQADVAGLVTGSGGAVLRHYWALSMLAVEVHPAVLLQLRAHRRVQRLVPVRSRTTADLELPRGIGITGPVPPPIATSTDSNNHCVQKARGILVLGGLGTPVSLGEGVRIAVFDSGIDSDASGAPGGVAGTPMAHPSFRQPSPNQSLSRIDAHLRAGQIDCNNIREAGLFGTPGPWAYRPCWHSASALHGTAVAGILAGNTESSFGFVDGHAPRARLVDVSITNVNQQSQLLDRDRWTTSDTTTLAAIQKLWQWILESVPPGKVHILNISFDGWSNPSDPVPTALDQLALAEDILIVTAAGNVPDETRQSNGSYNGLAVGSVHARLSSSEPFVPMGATATGPLNSDWRRYFPDVCATGAGPGTTTSGAPRYQYGGAGTFQVSDSSLKMPMIDVGDPCSIAGGSVSQTTGGCVSTGCAGSTQGVFGLPIPGGPIRFSLGTSEAAPQVSGAAALYRAARPSASAEETRAAVLLNVLSPFAGSYSGGTGQDVHAYSARNTFGVGYVRDDFLAEFAVGDAGTLQPTVQRLHAVVTLTPANPTAWVTYGSTAGHGAIDPSKRYAAAICWPRVFPDEYLPFTPCVADVDLEVWDSSINPTVRHARAATPANNYERVAFLPPAGGSGTVYLKITAASFGSCGSVVTVNVVARRFEPDLDPATPGTIEPSPVHATTGLVESLSAGPSCTNQALELTVTRTIPTSYADAWGSAPVTPQPITWLPNPAGLPWSTLPNFQGVRISPSGTISPLGSGPHLHFEIRGGTGANDQVGPSLTIGGLAFRSWRPFQTSGSLVITAVQMESVPPDPLNQGVTQTTLQRQPSGGAVNLISSQVTLPVITDIVPKGFDSWPLVIPFSTPFSYTTGYHLHIWLTVASPFPSAFEVDGAGDTGVPNYGMVVGTGSPPNYSAGIGRCPVMGLIPWSAAPSQLQPKLQAWGEPWVGRSVELELTQAPPGVSTPVVFTLGTWSPGTGTPCAVHVAPLTYYFTSTDTSGRARWSWPVPLNAALLHGDVGWQVGVLTSPMVMSNALRMLIGGGL